jgi:hypothetical protein
MILKIDDLAKKKENLSFKPNKVERYTNMEKRHLTFEPNIVGK